MDGAAPAAERTRRRRDPKATREDILAAARTVLASDGPDGLSLSKVAHLAGVNRGTAYQHFETREELIKATIEWVSAHLSEIVFGPEEQRDLRQNAGEHLVYEVITGLVDFAVENPELGRIWLFEVLSSENPGDDEFFRRFKQATETLAGSELSESGMDPEAFSVIMLAGYFLWPVWVRAQARNARERRNMAERMRREMLRFLLHGTLRPEAFPHLLQLLEEPAHA